MEKTRFTFSLEKFYDLYGKNAELLGRTDKLVLLEGLVEHLLLNGDDKTVRGIYGVRLKLKLNLSITEIESLLAQLASQIKEGIYEK